MTDFFSPFENYRFDTPPTRFSPRSRPAPAVPTSEFLSRTPARPPRPSTAGSCSELSSSSRTSRSTRRPSPCDDMPVALAALPKVRHANFWKGRWGWQTYLETLGFLSHRTVMLMDFLLNRQAVRCLPCSMARQVRRVPARSPEER